jgi:hypothetical protein
MSSDLSMTNESFGLLRNSNEFLNIILNNINECVLLLDKNLNLKAFNDSLKTIFSNKRDEDLLYMKCGEAIGCAYQIDEQKKCGTTTRCSTCELKIAALNSYMNNEVIFKDHIIKPFFDYNNKKVEKHLQFSTRLFHFQNDKYIIMIIEDISKFYDTEMIVN